MIRTIIMALIAVGIASSAMAGKNFLLFGVGDSSGAAAVNCGTGVIDLNAPGCSIAIPLGLVP